MNEEIEWIFKQQEMSEKIISQRGLKEMMLSEYVLSREQLQAVKENSFSFPACEESEIIIPEPILVRTQREFSLKIHYIDTAVYFHKHDFVEMLYVYRGRCTHYIDNLSNKIVLNENDLIFINQNVTHAIGKITKDDVILKMILPTEFLKSDISYQRLENSNLRQFFQSALQIKNNYYGYLVFHNDGKNQVKDCMEHILKEFYFKKPCYEVAIKHHFSLLLLEILRSQLHEEGELYSMHQGEFPLDEILREIDKNVNIVSLEYLSRKYGYNESYLSRKIRELTGSSFMELLSSSRCKRAEKLLTDSNLTLEYIASACGYKNVNALYRLMKKAIGKQPSDFRC